MYLALVELQEPCASRFIEMKFSALGAARRWAMRQAATLKGFTGHAAVFHVNGPLVMLAWELRGADSDAQAGLAQSNVDLLPPQDPAAAGQDFALPKFPVRGLFAHEAH